MTLIVTARQRRARRASDLELALWLMPFMRLEQTIGMYSAKNLAWLASRRWGREISMVEIQNAAATVRGMMREGAR